MILMTGARLRWPPTHSPGYAASSNPRRRWPCSTTAATRLPRSVSWRAASSDELLDWAAAYAEEHFVDLLEIVKAHYFGVSGLGLKLMARHVGFSWRDDDPGGLNSQLWFAEAVHGETAEVRARARRRVLEYNEDDVIATSQVRAWLRAQ